MMALIAMEAMMAVTASLLSSSYDPKVYNSLGDIMVVDKLVSEEQIRPLGDIILA